MSRIEVEEDLNLSLGNHDRDQRLQLLQKRYELACLTDQDTKELEDEIRRLGGVPGEGD